MGNRYFVFFCHFHLFISLNIIQNANYKGLIKESTFFLNIDERFTPQFEHDHKFSHLRILKKKRKTREESGHGMRVQAGPFRNVEKIGMSRPNRNIWQP